MGVHFCPAFLILQSGDFFLQLLPLPDYFVQFRRRDRLFICGEMESILDKGGLTRWLEWRVILLSIISP